MHPSGSFAKCFSCDVSVDVIELALKLGKHDNRMEAAKALSKRYGINLKFNGFDKAKEEESNVYQHANFHSSLKQTSPISYTKN